MKTATKTKAKAPAHKLAAEKTTALAPATAMVPASAMSSALGSVANVIRTAIENPRLDVKKMQAIIDMQMQIMKHQASVAYSLAMNACQREIPHITANKKNTHTSSKYADLDAIDTIIKPIYSNHGFSLTFDTRQVDATHLEVICYVLHADGQERVHRLTGELDTSGAKGTANKTGIQGTGSSATYLQRYLTKLIFNVIIAGEDKDGNAAAPAKQEGANFSDKMKGQSTTIENEPVNLDEQAGMMQADLQKLPTKKARLALINKNLRFLGTLDKAGREDLVTAIHTTADRGA